MFKQILQQFFPVRNNSREKERQQRDRKTDRQTKRKIDSRETDRQTERKGGVRHKKNSL
jgi:hypothetical protein